MDTQFYLPTEFTPAQLQEMRELAAIARAKHPANDERGQLLHNLERRLDTYVARTQPGRSAA